LRLADKGTTEVGPTGEPVRVVHAFRGSTRWRSLGRTGGQAQKSWSLHRKIAFAKF
jgi:hypothetical protein